MSANDIFGTPAQPMALNALYTRGPMVMEMMESVKKTNVPLWHKLYGGSVSSYDITGKGVQSRFLFLEQRRINARFQQDWQQFHNGCEPQSFETQTLSRPGLSQKYAHLFRMQKNTPFYHLDTIAAHTFNLARRLEADMAYLAEARYDLYNEYFMFNHLANSDRGFTSVKTSSTEGKFAEKWSDGEPVFRWANSSDKCAKSTDKLFLHPDIDYDDVQPLTVPALRVLQNELAVLTKNYDLKSLDIITDAFTQQALVEADSGLVQRLLYKALGNSNSLNPSLAANHNILELVNWRIDPLPWRGYYDSSQNSEAGEHCIVRIDPWIDVATEEGVETIPNPDYLDPNVATFQIDVPWIGETYEPMRAVFPERVSKVQNHAQTWAQWEWLNIKDNTTNPHGDKGYFSLRDNLMAAPLPKARVAPIILSRRYPLTANIITLPSVVAPSHESEEATTTCESIQFQNTDPDCVFGGAEGLGYSVEDYGGCDACQ